MKPSCHPSRRGAALIIVLAFLVILSGLVVAYLSRTTTDRQLAHGTFNQSRADLFARGALDVVIGDLKQEIANGSASPAPTFGVAPNIFRVYTPTLSNNIAPIPDGTPTDKSIPNLIKRSVASVPASPAVSSRASAVNSTTQPSLNGRSITGSRWNKHYLIPRTATPTGDNDTTPTGSFVAVAPDWVLLTRNGPVAKTWSTALSDSTPGNVNFVVGRYAYAIYDEGGLLDFNVAGYPVPTTSPTNYASTVGRKGLPAFADISATGLASDAINDVIGFRSYATVQPTGSFGSFALDDVQTNRYLTAIFGNTSGFIGVSPVLWNNGTDQAFTGRQALLKYWGSGGIGFAVGALQSLGTFSREVTTPSWSPDYDATNRGGTGFAYKANADTGTSINRDLNNVRVAPSPTPSPRFDGTPAVVGDYLIKRRFPLNRLAWITYAGPSADLSPSHPAYVALVNAGVPVSVIQEGRADNIKKAFGLVWDSRAYVPANGGTPSVGQQWVYTSPTASNSGGNFSGTSGTAATVVKTLATVQSEAREPEFFELLQAGILSGSLGQNTLGGTVRTAGGLIENPAVFPDIHMSSTMHHILSIAAAIVDQSDPDSIPTRIRMDRGTTPWTAYGEENLPYITEIYPVAGTSPTTPTQWATYLLFQLWNPHASVPSRPNVRLRVDGGLGVFKSGNSETWNPGTGIYTAAGGASALLFSTATFAPDAAAIGSSNATPGSGVPGTFSQPPTPLNSYIGFRLSDITLGSGAPNKPQVWIQLGASNASGLNPFNATMEVDIGGGVFVPYNHFIGINDPTSWITNASVYIRQASATTGNPVAFAANQLTSSPPYCLMKADPRATRFGPFQMNLSPGSNSRLLVPFWPASTPTVRNGYGGNLGSDVDHIPKFFDNGSPYLPGTLCINAAASSITRTGYRDPDGVIRPGDSSQQPNGANFNGSTPYDSSAASIQYKPIMLNRPLRNVGELGYAFRDLPWKSLDLFSDHSADAGLLDIFSVTDEPVVVAGRANVNSRQTAVIQSVIQGAIYNELDSTNTASTGGGGNANQSPTLASHLVTATSTSPLSNASGLVATLNLPLTILTDPNGTGQDNRGAKSRRELVARSITSMTQTRTWNLMIDLTAQSGRYPPTANGLADFVVEGEKRYWLHIAIDRFTGEVVDQQLEAVFE